MTKQIRDRRNCSAIYRKFIYIYNGKLETSVMKTSKKDEAAWRHLRSANYFEGIFTPLRIEPVNM